MALKKLGHSLVLKPSLSIFADLCSKQTWLLFIQSDDTFSKEIFTKQLRIFQTSPHVHLLNSCMQTFTCSFI